MACWKVSRANLGPSRQLSGDTPALLAAGEHAHQVGEAPAACGVRALEAVTRAAFGQRRKMLRQSLKALTPDPSRLLAAAGLPETARAEEIPVEGFVALARLIER